MTSDPSTGRTFTYGVQNELRTSGTFSLAYDALLRPADTSVSGAVTKQFTYDGMQIVAASNPGAGIAERYVWGDGPDELLVDYIGSGTATRRWAHQDERGSVIALSDAAGNAVAINKYDEFGKPQAGNIGRFQYTGQMWMPEVGLYHYKARTYSPTFGGRFLQTDPIGYEGGVNLYAYVGNDPVNFTDPLGLDRWRTPQNPPPPCPSDICVTAPHLPLDLFEVSFNTRVTLPIDRATIERATREARETHASQQQEQCPAPSNVSLNGTIVVGPAGPAYFTGSLKDVSTDRTYSVSGFGYGGGLVIGTYDVRGTVTGFNALANGLDIAFAQGPFGSGGARFTDNNGRSIGEGSVSGAAAPPLGIGGVSFDPPRVTQTNPGRCK